MKRILIRIALIITVISILTAAFSGAAVAYANKNIDYDLDKELFEKAKEDKTVYYYAYDRDGELTEVYKSARESVREWVSFEETGRYLKLGFIAMEDRDFYEHQGVNIKRTIMAALNHVFRLRSSFGASTITQQVIKNISGDNDVNVTRKLKEIFRALNLERRYSKDDIFEMYLNVVPMTGNIYGVSAASEIYFGKEANDLTLAEAATIVGITNAPAKYNPYTKPDACREKRNRVLYAMYDVGYITEEEYTSAVESPLTLSEGSGNYGVSSWFVETANEDIIRDLCIEYSLSRSGAGLILNGAHVILTMSPEVQDILEGYFSDTSNLSEKFKDGLNYSMVVSDPYSGDLLGIVGNGGQKRGERIFNYATSTVTPGSVLKPIALYAPLINDGKINWSTMLEDAPVEYIGDGESAVPYPKNTPDVYDGYIDINEALKRSKNTVAIRLYDMLGADRIFNSLMNDYGFDTLVKSGIGVGGEKVSDMSSSPLALGQLSYGVSLRKLTEAYNVFPNEGVFSSSRSYIRVYDRNGNAIAEKTTTQKRVMSDETAQVMNQLLSNVVLDGTARQIRLKELVDVAGKTGTSGNDRDRLFIGYTPYFTAGIWCGYQNGDKAVGQNTPSHLHIWDEVMTLIHDKLVFDSFDEELEAFSTDKLIIMPYCSRSGLAVSEECELDDYSSVRLGYFKAQDFPKDECDYHKHCLQEEDSVL